MVRLEQSSDHGVLQDFVEYLFRSDMIHSRLDIVVEAESFGLNSDLMEIVGLLPPGAYDRDRLCGQLNSALSSHGWGCYYGAVH